jgi:hypothetical protein
MSKPINKRALGQMYRTMGPAKTTEHITEALAEGELKPSDFSIAAVAEATMGREFVEACAPGSGVSVTEIMEAGDGTDSTAFRNITGQIVYTAIMQAFNEAAYVASGLVRTIPTRLSGEKIPGVSWATDSPKETPEGMPFERAGVHELYIETPPTRKYGKIAPVTKEAVFFDRTNLVLDTCASVGTMLGREKEKQLIDCLSGYGGGSTPTFAGGGKWKYKGNECEVYDDTTPTYTSTEYYINHITDTLTDHTDVDAARLQMAQVKDPMTQEPLEVAEQLTMLVPPALGPTAYRIANATEVRTTTGGSAYQALHSNPYGSNLKVVESALLPFRLVDNGGIANYTTASAYWFLGNFNKAFAWMENWPLQVKTAPTNSTDEFERDIIAQYRADWRGVPAVIAPQYVLRSTGAG